MRKNSLHQERKRRTTLTLPAESLGEAERIARSRRVNVSTVVAEALAEGLRQQMGSERCEEVLNAYAKAFSGFSEDELAILDGVTLEPTRNAARTR
jgi:hypothetical protein